MKLFYYKDFRGYRNFGDDLNAWLWPRLAPSLFDDDETCVFLGFGTLLNDYLAERVPRGSRKVVFSSGVGYGRRPPRLDETFDVRCVRGPLSANRLGLAPDVGITDGACLTREVFEAPSVRSERPAFMPHLTQAVGGEHRWRRTCERVGLDFIDPRGDVEDVLAAIACAPLLLTEALHGAVIADSLGVPWVPLAGPGILSFKWSDWTASLDLPYRPVRIPQMWDGRAQAGRLRRWSRSFVGAGKERIADAALRRALRDGPRMMSDRAVLDNRTARLLDLLRQVEAEYASPGRPTA